MKFSRTALLCATAPLVAAAPFQQTAPSKHNRNPSGGRYIVTFKDGVDVETHTSWVRSIHAKRDSGLVGIENIFQTFPGYSGEFDDATLEEFRANPDIVTVEEDREVTLFDEPTQPTKRQLITQGDAPWSLSSLSHRSGTNNGYIYDASAGAETWGYVIDTGINFQHAEFGGRALEGYNVDGSNPHIDYHGHGTHVAATMCGATYGVAKRCTLYSYKAFSNSTGSASMLLHAMDTATQDILWRKRQDRAVINISSGTDGYVAAIHTFAQRAYEQGVTIVAAAGNSNANASTISPASAPGVITVAALGLDGNAADFSNWGNVVDIYAPGVDVLSAWIGSTTATNKLSGTSMASPHIAGLALYLQAKEGLKGPDAIAKRIIELSTKGAIKNTKGSPNRRAYNGNGA